MDTRTFLNQYREKAEEKNEEERIKAGNRLMNFITDYFLEQKDYYQEEFGYNWYEAMNQDKIWLIEEDEFFNLLKEYYKTVI